MKITKKSKSCQADHRDIQKNVKSQRPHLPDILYPSLTSFGKVIAEEEKQGGGLRDPPTHRPNKWPKLTKIITLGNNT